MATHPFETAEDIVQNYSRIVRYIASKFKWALHSSSMDFSDLVSEGMVGLLRAYRSFDPNKGVKFVTHAMPLIKWEIQKHLREREQAMQISRDVYNLAGTIIKHEMKGSSAAIVSKRFSRSIVISQLALGYLNTKVHSLDRPIPGRDNDKLSIQDSVQTVDDLSVADVKEFLHALASQELLFVEMRLLGKSLTEIGRSIGCSKKQVSRIQVRVREQALFHFDVCL